MKQLVVLSGKGGTGKTSVAAALAHLLSQSTFAGRVVLSDADVDAANLELVLRPHRTESEPFQGGKVAIIDQDACVLCGRCEEVCRFDAIHLVAGRYRVDEIVCEGCAACVYQCPVDCITMGEQVAGAFHSSESRFGPLYHADLLPGQENSGKLVTLVRERAKLRAVDDGRALVFCDGPPGIGCPVISALSGTDIALIVAEPTAAGLHDLRRVLDTAKHFGVRSLVCINKEDIYPAEAQEIERSCKASDIPIVGRIPFDDTVPGAIVAGEPVTSITPDSAASRAIVAMWEEITPFLWEQS